MGRARFDVRRLYCCLLGVGLMLSGCASTVQVSPDVTVIAHTSLANLDPTRAATVTEIVPCGPGQTLVSGGYALLFNSNGSVQDVVRASFPSDSLGNFSTSPTAWTVTAGTSVSGGLTAEAVCITANFPISVQAVSQPSLGTATTSTAMCPPNTAVTGGGFVSSQVRVRRSAPSATGTSWTASYSPAAESVLLPLTAYAVCLSSAHLLAAPPSSTVLTISADTHPSPCQPESLDGFTSTMCFASSDAVGQIACGSGQIEVGGGFSNVVGSFYSDLPVGVLQSSPGIEGFLLYQSELIAGNPWKFGVHTSQRVLQGKLGSAGSITILGVCLSIKV